MCFRGFRSGRVVHVQSVARIEGMFAISLLSFCSGVSWLHDFGMNGEAKDEKEKQGQ